MKGTLNYSFGDDIWETLNISTEGEDFPQELATSKTYSTSLKRPLKVGPYKFPFVFIVRSLGRYIILSSVPLKEFRKMCLRGDVELKSIYPALREKEKELIDIIRNGYPRARVLRDVTDGKVVALCFPIPEYGNFRKVKLPRRFAVVKGFFLVFALLQKTKGAGKDVEDRIKKFVKRYFKTNSGRMLKFMKEILPVSYVPIKHIVLQRMPFLRYEYGFPWKLLRSYDFLLEFMSILGEGTECCILKVEGLPYGKWIIVSPGGNYVREALKAPRPQDRARLYTDYRYKRIKKGHLLLLAKNKRTGKFEAIRVLHSLDTIDEERHPIIKAIGKAMLAVRRGNPVQAARLLKSKLPRKDVEKVLSTLLGSRSVARKALREATKRKAKRRTRRKRKVRR